MQIRSLLRAATVALDCGVGPSLSAVSKHAANLTKLLTVQTPDDLLVGLAMHKARHPESLLSGIHFFPFGGLKRSGNHRPAGLFSDSDWRISKSRMR